MWWIMHHRFTGMKDGAISAEVSAINLLPIPMVNEEDRLSIEKAVSNLIKLPSSDYQERYNNEKNVNEIVIRLFKMSTEELNVMKRTMPPRDPLFVAKEKLIKHEASL